MPDRLARDLGSFQQTYLALDPDQQKVFLRVKMGVRSLKNITLNMLARQGDESVAGFYLYPISTNRQYV